MRFCHLRVHCMHFCSGLAIFVSAVEFGGIFHRCDASIHLQNNLSLFKKEIEILKKLCYLDCENSFEEFI